MPDTLTPPRLRSTVEVGAGRRLGLAEYGSPTGAPVIWLHGTPGGSGQIPETLRQQVIARDVRLVVIERPGYGRSTPHQYVDMASFVPDLIAVADRLGIERFSTAALSGGGPYTLAVAHAHPDRVISSAVLGGVTPIAGLHSLEEGVLHKLRPIAGLATRLRNPIGHGISGLVRVLDPVTDPAWSLIMRAFPDGDRAVFAQPHMKDVFLDDIKRVSRRSLVGIMLDFALFVRPWGFDPADITVPVDFWHGDADPLVTEGQARLLAAAIPGSTLVVHPGESHLGGFARAAEAMDVVLSRRS